MILKDGKDLQFQKLKALYVCYANDDGMCSQRVAREKRAKK
jgi:hypothetical protein